MRTLEGRSIYDEHLEKKGEGFHHVKLYYVDCRAALARFRAQGVEVIQRGKYDEDEFHDLDTEKVFGANIELGNARQDPEPDAAPPARAASQAPRWVNGRRGRRVS